MHVASALEQFYLSSLSPTQQDDWNAQMDDDPPVDAAGHSYVFGTRTAKGQVPLTRARQFAWQWAFGVRYFAMTPTTEPDTTLDTTINVTGVWNTAGSLIVSLNGNYTPPATGGILFYGWPNPSQSQAGAYTRIRNFAKYQPTTYPSTFDCTSAFNDTFTTPPGVPMMLVVWQVNTRGGLARNTALNYYGVST
jgi:hypothetical protein